MFASTKETASRKERRAEHLKDATESNGQDLDSTVHAMGKEVRDFIENAIDSADEGITQAKEKISDATGALTARVHKRPLAAIAIAAGVGVLVGVMFRRR